VGEWFAITFRAAVNKVLEHNYLYILVERNDGISKSLEVSRVLIFIFLRD